MQTKNSAVQIFCQENLEMVFVDNEFFKDLMVCSLSDLLFVLDNVALKEEVVCVIKEFATRLKLYGDSIARGQFLSEMMELVEAKKDKANLGVEISDYLRERTERSAELKRVLDMTTEAYRAEIIQAREAIEQNVPEVTKTTGIARLLSRISDKAKNIDKK